jgi:hypothetical protein
MSPDVYEFLEAEGYTHAIRLKINAVLQESIAHLLSRPVDRPPNLVRRVHASFSYQAGSWERKRRVVAKVEWHPGELYPRVGFNETHRLKKPRSPSPENWRSFQIACGATRQISNGRPRRQGLRELTSKSSAKAETMSLSGRRRR